MKFVPGRLVPTWLCTILFAVLGTTPGVAHADEIVTEGFQFEMRNLAVSHQGGNTLNLKVTYRYKPNLKATQYPDFTFLCRVCNEFFAHYPNQTDFWEVMNLRLTSLLLTKFPALASITIDLQVAPTSRIPHPRMSTVTRTRR